jgi:hypothetical protein
MLKKIREEKTFNTNKKIDIQDALSSLNHKEEKKEETESVWINELIARKKIEV